MEAEMHRALEIPEIREHILQFCSGRDLQSCRLVSKDWRDSSVKAWTSKARIRLADGWKASAFLGYLKSEHAPRKPFVNFCLSFPVRAQGMMTDFWGICGENVKTLKLSHCTFGTANDLRAVLFQACPNMEKLSLEEVSVVRTLRPPRNVVEPVAWTEPKLGEHRKLKSLIVDHTAKWSTGISWMEYFSHFSSLEVLMMARVHFSDSDMFAALTRVRERDPTKLNLKQIRLCYSHYIASIPIESLVNLLLDPGLQLESLAICAHRHLAHDIEDTASFSAILNANRASLRTLELNCHFREASHWTQLTFKLDHFPGQFENLTKATFMASSISSLNFLKFTPNLSKLFVKYDRNRPFCAIIEKTDFDGMGGAQLTQLETLELNYQEPSIDDSDYYRLMELMPNVRKLKMLMDNHVFELVCQRWEKLEVLEIVRGDVDSFGLIGLDSCPLFFRRRKNRSCIPFPTTATVARANITCLKNLRTLSMEGSAGYWHFEDERLVSLSHWAAHLGIEQLPHLEHLWLHNYNLETVCGVWERLLERYPWPRNVDSMVSEEISD